MVKKLSKSKIEYPEGCLSVPGQFGFVKRSEKITVEAYDEAGKKFIRGASKFYARVIQHELDHLNGVLFIDKVERFIDLSKEEEDFHDGEGATDFAMAKPANSDEFSLLQLDGKIRPNEVTEILVLASEACREIYEVQKKALKEAVVQQ